MRSMEKHLPILKQLQGMRGEVPTYVICAGIEPYTWIKVQESLDASKHDVEVDIVLNSSGGSPAEAYRMIRAFHEKFDTVNVIIPFWAKSAATLFAFGADRLVLHSCGELGPIDAQIRRDDEKSPDEEYSSALNVQSSIAQIEKRSREGMLEMFTQLRNQPDSEITKIRRTQLAQMLLDYSAKFYEPLLQKIEPMEMGQMARYLDVGRMYARRILKQYTATPEADIDNLLYFLVYECPDHGYVVDYHILKSFLPFVIRADESPFSAEYHKTLGELSMLLIKERFPLINGFLNSYLPQPTAATMETLTTQGQSKEQKK